MRYGIVVHGGAGGISPPTRKGCRQAAEVGMETLRQGGSSLDVAVAAVRWMEDSGRFNAGTGSVLRIDGTIEMDAVVATSQGLQGTVSAVPEVKNPVLLALEVARSNMRHISGPGGSRFAQEQGLESHPGATRRARQRLGVLKAEIRQALAKGEVPQGWTEEELRRFVGSDGAHPSRCLQAVGMQHDTVGAIALDRNGVVALAASTGGNGLMRSGRTGDVSHRGDGWDIKPEEGVLATGVGEAIIDERGADVVLGLLGLGFTPQQACEQALERFSPQTNVGFIALARDAIGIAANCPMASHSITEG